MEVLESLHGNVVCALAAGIGDYVRCTLLEYSYHDDQFWIFTEGGEKFIGLERNKNVSLAVFEKPPDFGALKSVLVMGTAKLIEPMLFEVPGFDEYSENLIKSSTIGTQKTPHLDNYTLCYIEMMCGCQLQNDEHTLPVIIHLPATY